MNIDIKILNKIQLNSIFKILHRDQVGIILEIQKMVQYMKINVIYINRMN